MLLLLGFLALSALPCPTAALAATSTPAATSSFRFRRFRREINPRLSDDALCIDSATSVGVPVPWNVPSFVWRWAWKWQAFWLRRVLHRWD